MESSNQDIQARWVVLGAGGHAKVLIDSLQAMGPTQAIGILDKNPMLWGSNLLGQPILGGDEQLPFLVSKGATHFIVGLGGIGDNGPRRRLYELGVAANLSPITVIHPTAVCSQWSTIGDGSVVFPSAVINAGSSVGVNVIVNTGAIVEHDCKIGAHVHLATGSRLCSTVHVESSVHIGAGATIRQGISIGEGAVVGAGAVVVKDVHPWSVVTGVPARLYRRSDALGHENVQSLDLK